MSYLLKLVFFLLYTTHIGATILFIKNLKNKEKILDGILAIASLLSIIFFHIHLIKK